MDEIFANNIIPGCSTSSTTTSFALWWENLCSNHSRGLIEFFIFTLTTLICFHIPATITLLLDLTFPSFSRRHKLQSDRRQPKWPQVKDCIKEVVSGTISGTILHFFILWIYNFNISMFRVSPDLPSLSEVAKHCITGLILKEILFYYSHRLLHHPYLYKRIHKKHHSFTAPITFAAQYAHPLENILVNNIPVLLPMYLLDTHILTFCLFLSYQLLETMSTHSGFDFWTWGFDARSHDLHHEKFNVYFGAMGWLDWMHGTDRKGWEKREGKALKV